MKSAFQSLAQELKRCPSWETTITPKTFHETWKAFSGIDPEQGDEVTRAMIAGVILHDEEVFAELLTDDELAQLMAISKIAWERYQSKINPLNPVGKPLAAALKELRKEQTT